MDIFAVGEEFTDGKNRLKPQCGVDQFSWFLGLHACRTACRVSNMCQGMNSFFLCWVLPVLTPEEITAFTRTGCVCILEKKCHLFFLLEKCKMFFEIFA